MSSIRIDLYLSAAMLSLRRIKALFLHGKPHPDANSVGGLPCKNKAFYSPETQHGRRVIKVYQRKPFKQWIRGGGFYEETAVLRRWEEEANVWLINRVYHLR